MTNREQRSLAQSRRAPFAALALLVALTLALVGCGATAPSLPSGVYSNPHYHFSVAYPTGWQVNESAQPNATAPLIVIITRSGSTAIPGSLISSLTIDVLSMSDATVAQSAAALSQNSALTAISLGGQPGYSDKPTQEAGSSSGAGGAVTLTHTDYYLVHGAYMYQISADALAGDGPALDKMVQSFTLLT